MPHLPSLPEDARLPRARRRFPHTARPLLGYDEVLLRGPSLRVPERDPVAACTETAASWVRLSQPAA